MKEGQPIQAVRLKLLALVLALALSWYAMNPAPSPVRRVKRDEEAWNKERHQVKLTSRMGYELLRPEADRVESAADLFSSVAAFDVEDLEWPEVIDLR